MRGHEAPDLRARSAAPAPPPPRPRRAAPRPGTPGPTGAGPAALGRRQPPHGPETTGPATVTPEPPPPCAGTESGRESARRARSRDRTLFQRTRYSLSLLFSTSVRVEASARSQSPSASSTSPRSYDAAASSGWRACTHWTDARASSSSPRDAAAVPAEERTVHVELHLLDAGRGAARATIVHRAAAPPPAAAPARRGNVGRRSRSPRPGRPSRTARSRDPRACARPGSAGGPGLRSAAPRRLGRRGGEAPLRHVERDVGPPAARIHWPSRRPGLDLEVALARRAALQGVDHDLRRITRPVRRPSARARARPVPQVHHAGRAGPRAASGRRLRPGAAPRARYGILPTASIPEVSSASHGPDGNPSSTSTRSSLPQRLHPQPSELHPQRRRRLRAGRPARQPHHRAVEHETSAVELQLQAAGAPSPGLPRQLSPDSSSAQARRARGLARSTHASCPSP